MFSSSPAVRWRGIVVHLCVWALLTACREEREDPARVDFACRLTFGNSARDLDSHVEIRLQRVVSGARVKIAATFGEQLGFPEERTEEVALEVSVAEEFRLKLRELAEVEQSGLDRISTGGTIFFLELREGDEEEPVLSWKLHYPFGDPTGRQWRVILAVRQLLHGLEMSPETEAALRDAFEHSFGLVL